MVEDVGGEQVAHLVAYAQRLCFSHGGAQERGKRGGTEKLPGIVGMAVAMEDACNNMDANNEKVVALRDKLKESKGTNR